MEAESPITVGVEKLDAEHRQILRRVRQIRAAAAERRAEEVAAGLKFLHLFLAEHFADEEGWMVEAGYPGLLEHGRHHTAILQAFADGRGHGAEDPALSRAALDLCAALEEHMRSEDVKIARFFTARENLRRLAEAGPGVGACLTPLPGSHPPAAPPDPTRRPR
jgi:hemerythrin